MVTYCVMNLLIKKLKTACDHFWPQAVISSRRERIVGCVGAAFGIILTEWLCRLSVGESVPWLIAPMGASAVLMFAVPASPLAQPWAVIGGNLLASVVGVTCALAIPDASVAAALAVAISIALMFPLRCLHPPSGAVAITAVLGGPTITHLGYGFALYPVLLNSLLLTGAALLFNNTMKRRYPHSVHSVHSSVPPASVTPLTPAPTLSITAADLQAALKENAEVLDIDEDSLLEVFSRAESIARRRHALDASETQTQPTRIAS